MPVGAGSQPTAATTNQDLTNIAVAMRNVMEAASNLNKEVTGAESGLTYLESIGFGSAANSDNPGAVSDAQFALNMIGYLNTLALVYYGGATQPSAFNFDNALSVLWDEE
jgi:hypothetical protein